MMVTMSSRVHLRAWFYASHVEFFKDQLLMASVMRSKKRLDAETVWRKIVFRGISMPVGVIFSSRAAFQISR